MGTGAQGYSEPERAIFGSFLREIDPLAFISRDDISYDLYADFVSFSFKGIDCCFFLPEAYSPGELSLPPYIVASFDSMLEPPIDGNGYKIIRAHHNCLLPSASAFEKPETLLSDIPYDYLTLYANAEEVYSDRAHACVAALSYGRKARFYNPTPRGHLFESVGAADIRARLVQLNMDLLKEKKKAMIKVVREILEIKVA